MFCAQIAFALAIHFSKGDVASMVCLGSAGVPPAVLCCDTSTKTAGETPALPKTFIPSLIGAR
jgi:hypothetical protein